MAIIFGSAFSLQYLSSLEEEVRNHHLIAIYPTEVPGHHPVNNTEQFLADLALVKELGFEGVRLHPADYENYTCGKVADDLENLGLKFIIVIEFNITNDTTLFNQRIDYFRNVAQQLVNKPKLLWYAFKYPYDWNKTYTQTEDPNYRIQLQMRARARSLLYDRLNKSKVRYLLEYHKQCSHKRSHGFICFG